MSYKSPFETFIFENYTFEPKQGLATFHYSFDGKKSFYERVHFPSVPSSYSKELLDQALFLAFVLAGISYYKCFPTKKITFRNKKISPQQADFFSEVYLHGLGQFIFENDLSTQEIAQFGGVEMETGVPRSFNGDGVLLLQSGGKDSLLLAEMLQRAGRFFTPLHVKQHASYPHILDSVHGAEPLQTLRRELDKTLASSLEEEGALNGHVPVTYIILSYALVDAILQNKSTVLVAIGREGEEPHGYVDNLSITHQWSKTWRAEQLLTRYIDEELSPNIKVGSPLRGFSELKIAKLFSEIGWEKYGRSFSSCNVANYKQGHDNTDLVWCGNCSKCANSFLLFAPFIAPDKLIDTFGRNVFQNSGLVGTFKGLLGIDDVIKPFECVGEIDELRKAYYMAREKYPEADYQLPFDVPESSFDLEERGPAQQWAQAMIQ